MHKRIKKASDVYRETIFVYRNKLSFEEEFPQIKSIDISVSESGIGVKDWKSIKSYNKNNLPEEYIDCSNSMCYNGGFSIKEIIRKMVSNHLSNYETTELCQGYEGSPNGQIRYRDCLNGFHVNVKITYND